MMYRLFQYGLTKENQSKSRIEYKLWRTFWINDLATRFIFKMTSTGYSLIDHNMGPQAQVHAHKKKELELELELHNIKYRWSKIYDIIIIYLLRNMYLFISCIHQIIIHYLFHSYGKIWQLFGVHCLTGVQFYCARYYSYQLIVLSSSSPSFLVIKEP